MEDKELRRRRGRLFVPDTILDLLVNLPYLLNEIGFIPIQAEHGYDPRGITYMGYCPHFDAIDNMHIPTHYYITDEKFDEEGRLLSYQVEKV